MTTLTARAASFAAALDTAPAKNTADDAHWIRWESEPLPQGVAWMRAHADILPRRLDASWRQMDNGPLLTLRAPDVEDLTEALSASFALSLRFGVGVSTFQPAGLGVVGVSVERISTNGFRVGGLRVDFSASVRTAVKA